MSMSFKDFINDLKSGIKNINENSGVVFSMNGEKDGKENLLHVFEFKYNNVKGEFSLIKKDTIEIEVNRKSFTIKDKALANMLDKHKSKYATQEYKTECEFNDKKAEALLIKHLQDLKISK